jgi:protein transport protein SEC23
LNLQATRCWAKVRVARLKQCPFLRRGDVVVLVFRSGQNCQLFDDNALYTACSNPPSLSWNVWPSTRIEATRYVVPIGAMYTPLKEQSSPPVPYEPVTCKPPCRAVLNPYCQVDLRARLWVCPFCLQRNQFPPHYKDMSETNLPAELLGQFTTIEYTLARPATIPPVFLYVIDTCLDEVDLKALKESVIVSLGLLPPQSLVGLISFGTMVQVHELGYSECSKSFVFRAKEYTPKQILEMLNLSPAAVRPGQPASFLRFLQPISQCEVSLTSLLENLPRDAWPVANDKRALRATGTAISVAVGLLEACFPAQTGSRVMSFLGGACTSGPGEIVGPELREALRSHNDLEKDTAKHYKKAVKFYEGVAKRAAEKGHIIDMFVGCLDQVGLLESKSLANATNGYIVIADSFNSQIFKQSFLRIFSKDENGNLAMGFNATLDVQCTKELRICGLIGPAVSANKKSASIGDTEIGIGNTSAWKICGLNPSTAVAVYFEVANTASVAGSRGLMQFVTYYQHSTGQYRLRVTTVARKYVYTSRLMRKFCRWWKSRNCSFV